MGAIERIAVLGAGPGGSAIAAALTNRGFHVALYSRSSGIIEDVERRGGIELEGDLGESLAKVATVTSSPERALRDAQLVLIAVPANGQIGTLEQALPFLKRDSILLFLSGSCATLEAAALLREAGHDLATHLLIGETVTLPLSARFTEPAKLRIRLPSLMRAAAFPGNRTKELVDRVGEILRLLPQRNVLDPGLKNPNFLIHPAPMLLNYAAVERADGYLSIMNEGMTPGVLRCLDAVDAEKMALLSALGLEPTTIDDLYRETGSGPHVYRVQGEPFALRDRIWPRYVEEDVPFGTVMFSSLGRLLSVPTPVCDGINHVLSVVEEKDYWRLGRTVDKLGLDGLSLNQINAYVESGVRPTA